jgi:hypothetical protein
MRVLLKELPDQDVRLVGGDRLAVLFFVSWVSQIETQVSFQSSIV